MCMFCRSLFVLSYFFFWPLCCLFFFDMRILITSLWYLQTFLTFLFLLEVISSISYLLVTRLQGKKPKERVLWWHWHHIDGVIISVLALSIVDRGFEPWWGKIKDYKIDICYFSAKHAALRRKSKDWLARNQDNITELGNMSIRGVLLQWVSVLV